MVSRSAGPMESLAALSREGTSPEEKIKAYTLFSEYVKQDSGKNVGRELQNNISSVYDAIMTDITSENALLANAALHALGAGQQDNSTIEAFLDGRAKEIISALCKVVSKTADKTTCTRALWCIATQNLPTEVVALQVEEIMSALTTAQANETVFTMIVEHEAINLVIKLLEQAPSEMENHVTSWAKLVYKALVHTAPKIRERAMLAAEAGLPSMNRQSLKIAATLAVDLKGSLLASLTTLLASQNELYALKVWRIYIGLLGKVLHHGHLINSVLPIVEKAFKNSNHEVKCEAYLSWKTLIDNFSLDPSILSDAKRVKLIMQVFRINNAKSEKVALTKLDVWWYFAQQLGSKLAVNCDTVITPLLHFCVGGGAIQNTANKGMTPKAFTPGSISRAGFASPSPHISIGSGSGHAPLAFPAVRQRGFEILVRVLGTETSTSAFKMAALKVEFPLTVSLFAKHGILFIQTYTELVTLSGADSPGALVHDIWYSLVAHTKNVLENLHGAKREGVDVLAALVNGLRHIVNTQALNTEHVLTLLSAIMCLPAKILGSVAYNIGTSQTEIMQGCPALVLAEILFHHRNIEVCSSQEKFFTILQKIISCGQTHPTQLLSFLYTILQLVDVACRSVENIEAGWRMWGAVANPLLQHILKTNEVNQGDTLEHDFSCMYLALHCPLNRLVKPDLPQATVKTLLKTWSEFYVTFDRLAAMVANVDANVQNEELCSKILSSTTLDKLKDAVYVEGLIQCCLVMSEHIDFSAFSNQSNQLSFGNNALMSPSRYAKRRQKPLGHLNSFVKLVALLLNSLMDIDTKISTSEIPFQKYTGSLSTAAMSQITILSMLFSHLPSSAMVEAAITMLASPMMLFFDGAKKSTSKMYSQPLLQKMEKLWQEVTTCIQGRYNGSYDSDFLADLSPLLEATLLHPRRAIKNQALQFWTATFAHGTSLTYPEKLKPVLATVKQKTSLVLPGWDDSQIMVIEDTPVSQMSQAESQVPAPQIVGIPSPVKQRGSFMNRECSPNVKNSPLRPTRSPAATGSARKVLPIDDMNSRDFTVITPTSTKRKRVLTDHQKEVLKERRLLPAMYNNLDASQDVSLMSQFSGGSDSQMSMHSPLPTPTFDFANPGFPIVLPTKKQKLNDESSKTTEAVVMATDVVVKSEVSAVKSSPDTTTPSSVKRRRSVRFAVDDDGKSSTSSPDQTENSEKKLHTAARNVADAKEVAENSSVESLPKRSLRSRDKDLATDAGTGVTETSVTVKVESDPEIEVSENGNADIPQKHVSASGDVSSKEKLGELKDGATLKNSEVSSKVALTNTDSPSKRTLRARTADAPKEGSDDKLKTTCSSESLPKPRGSKGKTDKDAVTILVEDTEMMDSEVSQSVLQPNVPPAVNKVDEVQIIETQSEAIVIETQSLAENRFPDSSVEVLSEAPEDAVETDRSKDKVALSKQNTSAEELPSSQDEDVSPSQDAGKKTSRKKEQTRKEQRGSKSNSQSGSQSDSGKESSQKSRRSRANSKTMLSTSPKSPSRLESWLIRSPRKIEEKSEKAAVITYAEETQQFSPNKENAFSSKDNIGDKDICVGETPVKVEKAVIVDVQEKTETSKTLFGNVLQETPEKQLPGELSKPFPVVQLVSLSPVEIETALAKSVSQTMKNGVKVTPHVDKSGSDSDGSIAGSKEGRRKSGMKRRASLLRFSKAATTPSSQTDSAGREMNMDDIVPSSQDAFAFQVKASQVIADLPKSDESSESADKSSITVVADSEAVIVASQDGGKNVNNNCSIRAVVADDKDNKETECDLPDSEPSQEQPLMNSVVEVEDPLPADVDTESSQNSQATIITKPKRRKSKTVLDKLKTEELPESSQSQQNESSPRRTKRTTKKKKCPCPDSSCSEHDAGSVSVVETPSDVASSIDTSQDSTIEESVKNTAGKKRRGRSKKQPETKVELGSTLTNDTSSPSLQQNKTKTKSRRSSSKDADILENIVNKQCNLDSDGDSDDDIPLNQLNSTSSSDDIPLNQLSQRDESVTGKDEGSQKEKQLESEPASCTDLFEGSAPADTSVEEAEAEKEAETSLGAGDSSLNESGSADDCTILSSSQKKKQRRKGLEALSASLSIDMKVDERKSLRSTKSARSQPVRQIKKVSPKRRVSLKLKRKMKTEKPAAVDSAKNDKIEVRPSVDGEDEDVEPESNSVKQETKDSACDMNEVSKDSKLDHSDSKTSPVDEDCDLVNEAEKDSKVVNEVEMDSECGEDKVSDIIDHIEKENAALGQSADVGVENTDKADVICDDGVKTLADNVPDDVNRTDVGTTEGVSSNVSSPRTVVSPPKKGKPFDMPETPTSATKHRSRASMILERARIICMSKNQASGTMNRRKFTALRPSGLGSPRTILQSRPSSILKPSSGSPRKDEQGSPSRDRAPGSPSFRPVHMPRVYSPSASPSAGILKKRKLCMMNGPAGTDSPSPPNKQRRVSFNEEIEVCVSSEGRESPRPVNRCLELARGTLTQSPLALPTNSAASKLVSGQTRFLTTPSSSFKLDKAMTEEINTAFAVPKSVRQKESQLTPSQASAASTQESQLNAVEPIFPELTTCSAPVEQILPQLTSSMWIRGLGQLVRARSIRTIGDLCSLSEYDVHNLPIRSPKVTTMRKVLQTYQVQHGGKVKSSAAAAEDASDINGVESDLDSLPSASTSPVKTLPQLEDELRKMSPIKGDLDTSLESEVSLNLETGSHDVTPNKAATPRVQEDLGHHHMMDDPAVNRLDLTKSRGKLRKTIMKDIESMAATMTPANLALLPSDQLVRIHGSLNTMMSNVVMALKDKCPVSPNGSQSSQESLTSSSSSQ